MSIWDKAINDLPPLKDNPHAQENAAYLRKWLAYVGANPGEAGAFDAALERFAQQETALRAREEEREIAYQGSGYLFLQYTALYGPKDEHWPECERQIDRRMAARGLAYCRWRGWVTKDQFDAWRWDNAQERARLPNKGERGAA